VAARLSKTVDVWQNAHISKNRKAAATKNYKQQ
jgi:hypothetical protein